MAVSEELYTGCVKKMKVSKREVDATGRTRTVDQVLIFSVSAKAVSLISISGLDGEY